MQHFLNDTFQSYYDLFQVNWLLQNKDVLITLRYYFISLQDTLCHIFLFHLLLSLSIG